MRFSSILMAGMISFLTIPSLFANGIGLEKTRVGQTGGQFPETVPHDYHIPRKALKTGDTPHFKAGELENTVGFGMGALVGAENRNSFSLSDKGSIAAENALSIKVSAYGDTVYALGSDGKFDIDRLLPQANRLTLQLSNNDIHLDDIITRANLKNYEPTFIVGAIVQLEVAEFFIQQPVLEEANRLIGLEAAREIRARTPEVERTGRDQALTRLNEERQSQISDAALNVQSGVAEIIEQRRQRLTPLVPGKVRQAVFNNPEFNFLTQPNPAIPDPVRLEQLNSLLANQTDQALEALDRQLQEAFIQLQKDFLQAATTEIDSEIAKQEGSAIAEGEKAAREQLEGIVNRAADRIRDRVKSYSDEIALESTFHQVAIGVGKVLEDGHGVLFMKVGKIAITAAARTDINGRTRAETLSGFNTVSGAVAGVGNTIGVNFGRLTPSFSTSAGARPQTAQASGTSAISSQAWTRVRLSWGRSRSMRRPV
ncbi:MAG: hypothetical protein AAF203_02660, partial [Pseudomonadota bacterium]